jgi:hypothetical protein
MMMVMMMMGLCDVKKSQFLQRNICFLLFDRIAPLSSFKTMKLYRKQTDNKLTLLHFGTDGPDNRTWILNEKREKEMMAGRIIGIALC